MKDFAMLRKLAWSFHHSTGVEYDELVGEAAVAYAEAEKDYDPTRGAQFTTWATTKIRNALIDYCKKERRHQFTHTDLNQFVVEEVESTSNDPIEMMIPDGKVLVRERMSFSEEILSIEELKTIYDMIFSAPTDLLSMAPKLARGVIVEKLRQLNWPWSKIWGSFAQMKAVLNNKTT
jgi:RNA polymerase sigma factor (sigma-70 family)